MTNKMPRNIMPAIVAIVSFAALLAITKPADAAVPAAQTSALLDAAAKWTSGMGSGEYCPIIGGCRWEPATCWNTTTDPCANPWYGVKCDSSKTNVIGISTSATSCLNLAGPFPSGWSALTGLQALDMALNQFTVRAYRYLSIFVLYRYV